MYWFLGGVMRYRREGGRHALKRREKERGRNRSNDQFTEKKNQP